MMPKPSHGLKSTSYEIFPQVSHFSHPSTVSTISHRSLPSLKKHRRKLCVADRRHFARGKNNLWLIYGNLWRTSPAPSKQSVLIRKIPRFSLSNSSNSLEASICVSHCPTSPHSLSSPPQALFDILPSSL